MSILDTQFDLDTIGQILTIFVIADSLLSLAVTYIMERRALARWKTTLWIILVIIWVSVILPLIELQISSPPLKITVFGQDIYNIFTKVAVLVWFIAIVWLLIAAYRIFTLDLIKFKKSGLAFVHNEEKKWGVRSINYLLFEKADKMYYPIVLLADEYSRPWNLLQRFLVSGLSYGPHESGGVYFSFARPERVVFEQLEHTKGVLEKQSEYSQVNRFTELLGNKKVKWKNIVIIDCYVQFAKMAASSVYNVRHVEG
jgi:hypothetical protein